MSPPWGSKYTVNINTEMNYWPAEETNLSECTQPLIAMIRDISETGARTAKTMWGARGWVCNHNTDLWRATGPIDGASQGYWPTGGAWLSTNLWLHYLFTGDKAFLKGAYPILKGASLFFVDTLVEEPEHHSAGHRARRIRRRTSIRAGRESMPGRPWTTMEILRDLFFETGKSRGDSGYRSTISRKDSEKRLRLRHVAPIQVGKHGQLQEWLADWDNPKDEHRHVSHLYAVYPSDQITPDSPELFGAARQSLIYRGDGGTGWSKAWKISFWARFLDGDHARTRC